MFYCCDAGAAMDWQLAIEKNREALKRILIMLVAMAGLSELATSGSTGVAGGSTVRHPAHTVPRHLHRFMLRLLRPAEAAARRLIIVAARGRVVELAPARTPKPKMPLRNRSNGFGTGIVIRPGPLPDWARALAPKRSANLSLSLFDPLKRFGARRRYVKQSAVPHIRSFDDMRVPFFQPPRQPDPPPPSPDDLLDAGRLHRRIAAIGRALDDLPRQAKRLARWRARRDAAYERDAADHPPRRCAPTLPQGRVTVPLQANLAPRASSRCAPVARPGGAENPIIRCMTS
jgi:hypothetical protein